MKFYVKITFMPPRSKTIKNNIGWVSIIIYSSYIWSMYQVSHEKRNTG